MSDDIDSLILPEEERWENLTLANDFMFGHVMRKKSLCLEMMRRILPEMNIGDIDFVDIQKTMKAGLDSRGVRFDMYIESESRKVYDVEIQTSRKPDIARRTRAYHAMMGGDILDKYRSGGRTYSDIPDTFVIFICTFDPFSKGKHVYTFMNFCCEDKNLALNDGGTTIFLNTRGKDKADVKLKAFLDFIMGRESEDPFIQTLSQELDIAKHNAKWRGEYMKAVMERNEAVAEGLREGLRKGHRKGLKEGERKGRKEGRIEGRIETQLRTARLMIAQGFDEKTIHAISELPVDEIRKLAESLA